MGLFQLMGMVSAARLEDASERLRKAQARVESLSQKLEEVQAESRAWRTKLEDSQKRLEHAEERAAREAQRLEKFKAESARDAVREKKRNIDMPALEKRLDDADGTLVTARDHLMSVEVKLDILEGAANVLDARTRTLLANAGS
jgi:chromosome segregation ATPase